MEEIKKCLEYINSIEPIEYKIFYNNDYNRFGIIPLDRNGELLKTGETALLNRIGIYAVIKSKENGSIHFLIIDEPLEPLESLNAVRIVPAFAFLNQF